MRVIAGSARGRPLLAPRSERVRPTTDRVKEAIFSMLEAEAYKRGYAPGEGGEFASALAWPRVLELYAGSGALAIEALSRGARWADLVEPDAEARRTIQANLARTGLAARAHVYALSAQQALERLAGPYDLVMLDPPYADPTVLDLLKRLGAAPIFAPGAIMVVEHAQTLTLPSRLGAFELLRERRHGSAWISLYGRAADAPPDGILPDRRASEATCRSAASTSPCDPGGPP